MNGLQLTDRQLAELERQLRETRNAGVFRRTLAILEVARGRSLSEIAEMLRTSRVSIHHWLERYRRTADPTSLLDHRGGNRSTLWTDELEAVLRASLAHRPDYFGYQAIEWTVGLLQEHLRHWCGAPPSATALRRELHRLAYVWKRPRYWLQPDPEREKKTADSPLAARPAAPHRQTVRGRDRLVAVPAVAERLGAARQTRHRTSERGQRSAGCLRHH
jgi:transposase